MTKILFLDVDGVLNNEWSTLRSGPNPNLFFVQGEEFDKSCLEILKKIITDFNYQIVLSSDWRLWERTRNVIEELLGLYDLEFIDYTTSLGAFTPRGHEIQKWLDDHPEVTDFAILDDCRDMAHLMPHLIRTDYHLGLTMTQYNLFKKTEESGTFRRK